MAEDKDLIFPMKLELDVKNFEVDWKKIEPKLQAVLDKNPLKARIDIDEAKLKNAIAQLSKLNAVNGIPKQSTQSAMLTAQTRSRIMLEEQLARARERGAIAVEKQRIATANAEKAELSLERAKQRGIDAVHTQNKAYQAQRGILNGLPQFINSYVSILGAYRLGQNIVDTTAEFEMQRVALAAIIQDKQKADQLFSQNVELGLQSPFQIKELITYTKQLAAFRIETDQLFDTTKRLADVSAGLGVDMGRLILAYGQVKAASVLRGQEVRQFTEAGIPIIQLLADKFTKLNGTATSTADVFKLISERGVSFGQVKEVFEDMTNAGGTFYRMQEIQAQTLKGSLANLTDAYQKMFMEMGNANMAPMKATINGLREVMENWEVGAAVLTDVAIGYGIAKVSILAYNAALGKENAANIASIMTAKKKEATLLMQSSAYKTLNAQELTKIATSKAMTVADWEQLVVTGKLTEAGVLRLVAVRRMTPAMANQLIATQAVTKAGWGLNAAQIATAASSNKLTVAFRLMTASAWAATKALFTNPLTWVVVAAAGVVKLVSSIVSYNRKYSEMVKNVRRESALLANEMTDAWENMAEVVKKGLDPGASSESMVSARKSLQDILSKNELIRDVINERLKGIDDEAVKLGIVKDMWDTVHAAAKGGGGDMALAQKDTGNWLNADVVDNAKKFNDQLDKTDKYLSDMGKQGIYVTKIRKEFESLREQLNKGEISLSDFRKGLYNTFSDNKPIQQSVEFANKLYKLIRNTSASAVNLDADMNNFLQSYIARAGEIEGQMPMLNAENMGLTPAALNTYHAAISTQSNLWFNTLGDDLDAGTKRVLTSLIRLKSAFPKLDGGDALPETPFIQSYNAFIKSRGLSIPMLEMPKAGDAPTDRSQREKIGEQLKSDKERLAEVKSMLQNRGVLTAELLSELGKEKEKLEKSVSENDQIWRMLLGGTYNTTTTRPSTDPRIAALKGQLDLVVDAYDNYLKRVKQVGETQARADVEGIYGGQNAEIKGITSGLPLAFTPEGLNAVIEQAKAGFGTLGKDAMATLRGVILKQNDENFEDLTRNFKENLDRLATEIQQTQRANEFYEKMLGLTGSAEMAKRLTEAMGMTVGDVREGMYSALREIMGTAGDGVNLSDVNAVNKAISGLPETIRKAAQGQLAEIIDYEQKQLAEIYSGLEDYMTAQERKVKIAAETQRRIAQIEGNKNLTPEEKAKLINLQKRGLKQEYAKIDLEELKKTERYVKAFEDLDRVGDKTLTMLRDDLARLAKTADDPTALKTITDQIQKIDELLEGRKPFSSMVQGLNDYRVALNEVSKIGTEFADNSEDAALAQDKLKAAIDKVQSSAKKMKSDFDEASGAIQSVINFSQTLADTLGLSFSDETNEYIKAFTGGIEVASSAMSVMTAVTLALDAAMAPLLIAAAAIGLLFVGVSAATNLINAKTESDIRNNADAIEVLSQSISKLNKSLDKSLGSEYVKNIQEQIRLKQEQIALEQEQIASNEKLAKTRANGWWLLGGLAAYGIAWLAAKKKEKEATAAIEKSQQEIDKLQDEIEMLERTLMQEVTGYPSVTDAASDFANAWLDAYISFENTTDAIKGKFKDMIDNMIVQSILARTIEVKLRPVFKAIEQAYDDGKMTVDELRNIQNLSTNVTIGLDSELSSLMAGLEAGGINVRASDRSLTGISASVAAMSEDTANTFGGYLNMGLMQWVQQTNLQTQILAAVKEHDLRTPMANLFELQQQSLAAINGIKSDTAKLVLSNAEIVSTMKSVLNGTGTKGLNVYLKN